MKKILAFVLAFVVVFASTSMIAFAATEDTVDSFAISAISFTEEKVPTVEWFLADDGNYYLFVPTSISASLCRVSFVADGDVTIDGKSVKNGDMITLKNKSSISVSCGAKTYDVKIIAETELASVFITTESGSLDAIHADKEYKEAGYIQVIGEDGLSYEYNGDLEYIKGRGNSTWQMEKKPYNIKLDKKANLFGMGKSKKWSFIANHTDTSLMRNAIIYSVAGEVLDYTPKYTPVDLYINNDYMGSYILTTRVEIDDNRVEIDNLDDANEDANPDIDFDSLALKGTRGEYSGLMEGTQKWVDIPNDPDDISGGYLMEMEIADRYDGEISGFVSDGGQPVIFKNPEYATENEVKYISGVYQNFEDAVMSADGYNADGDYYTDLCDVETFQKFYAINEWSSNMDCGLTSTYMYKPQGDDKLYAGPVWDFDIALGNNNNNRYGCNYMNPEEFTVCFGRQYKNTIFGQADIKKVPTLFNALCQKEDFVAGVKTVWDNEILDAVNAMNENGIDDYADKIEGSAVANAIRWNIYGTSDIDAIKSNFRADVDFVKDFSTRRAIFLTNNFGTVQTTNVESGLLDGVLSGLGDAVEGLLGGVLGGNSGSTDTTPDSDNNVDNNNTDTDNNTNTDNETNADTDANGNGNAEGSDIPNTVAGASIVVAAAVAIASGVGIVATIKKREE
ncbi:MAG: CotH kinase family protein [Clostridia bacterium]|nr:CotH kinase family protein [Clostridia bacterium]